MGEVYTCEVSTRTRAAVGGGVADKWGNRYEAWWTVWKGVLPVLRGQFEAIRPEPPDLAGEGAEFRLFGSVQDASDEVHQCKRRHTTSWTVKALDTEGLLRPFGNHLAQGVRAVFASGTPSVLEGMSKKATRLSQEEWAHSLSKPEQDARDELVVIWNTSERKVWDRLSRLTVRTIDEDTLRDVTVEAIASVVDGDPSEALLRLADHVVDKAMERLTANQLWEFLRNHNFAPREGRDVAVSELMRDLNGRYVQGVVDARPNNLPLLWRGEVDRVVEALMDPGGPRVVVVTGGPGSGKSTTIAETCKRLTELGVVMGPLRLDAASEAWTAEELGAQGSIGFGGPPARVLVRAAGSGQAVLVVDQLDALSSLAGRGETIVEGARQMLAQAKATEGVRVLIGCRGHDLQHDRQLRRLLTGDRTSESDTGNLLTVAIGDLDDAQLNEGLTRLGMSAAGLPARLRQLLANPFNLSILANIVEDTGEQADTAGFNLGAVRTRHDLLAEYDRRLARRLRNTLGADVYTTTVSRIARLLSESGQLSLDRILVADIPDAIDALVHEGVLVADQNRLRFFHQEFFDYVFAVQHVRNGQTAADVLRGDLQDLIRRGQVNAVLILERQQDWPGYLKDLHAVLNRSLSRSHIRAAVLTWLTDLATVEDDELRIVLEVSADDQDPLCQHGTRTLASELFVRALDIRGLLPALAANLGGNPIEADHPLARLVAGIHPHRSAYVLYEGARYLPEAVSLALIPHAGKAHTAMQRSGAILRAVLLAGPTADLHTAELFITLTQTLTEHALTTWATSASEDEGQPQAEGMPDIDATIRALFTDQSIHALNTLVRRAPTRAAAAIRTWLESALQIALFHGARHAFDQSSPLPHQQTGLELFQTCAVNAPSQFVCELTPLLIDQLERSSAGRKRWRPAGEPRDLEQGLLFDTLIGYMPYSRGFQQEIYRAFRTALCRFAEHDPQGAAPMVRLLTETELLSGHQLAAAAFSVCGEPLLGEALTWAADPRVRGLPSGLTSGWAWGEVLANVAANGSSAQTDTAITLALDAYDELDPSTLAADLAVEETAAPQDESTDHRARAWEQLVALTLINRRLGEQTPTLVQSRMNELEGLLGTVPATPEPQVVESTRHSPIPEAEAHEFSDDDWLAAIRTYADDPGDQASVRFGGGAYEVATQLETAAKSQPGRFARLVGRIGPDANPAYVRAILRAVNSTAQDLDADDQLAAIDAVRTISGWPTHDLNRELCDVIGALADVDLPDDILDLTTAIATTASEQQTEVPEIDGENLIVTGLNRDRGQAVYAMARLGCVSS